MKLLLRRARIPGRPDETVDVLVARGRIVRIGSCLEAGRGTKVLDLADRRLVPGSVNAHDHLGLDLFPRLGSPPYGNPAEWSREVHRPEESPLREILRVPPRDRLRWGAVRNLLSGATTVVHHDPWPRGPFGRPPLPVRVHRTAWAHSLGFSPDVRARHRAARGRPFVLHAAEGTDEDATAEVSRLEKEGVLGPSTVLVHAMALSDADVALLARRRVAVICCPVTQHHLYGETTPVARLRRAGVPVALGTDSTLSGAVTLGEEVDSALELGLFDSAEAEDAVTRIPARIFGLPEPIVDDGAPADLVCRGGDSASILAGPPLLVLVGGRIAWVSEGLAPSVGRAANVEIDAGGATVRGWMAGDPAALRRRIRAAAGPDVDLGPLWPRVRPFDETASRVP